MGAGADVSGGDSIFQLGERDEGGRGVRDDFLLLLEVADGLSGPEGTEVEGG